MTSEDSLTPEKTTELISRSAPGMTTKVVKGSLWTFVGQVAPLLVSLITTPFVIRMLGAERYGIYVLAGLIPGYLLFSDLGMGMASTKFGSAAFGRADLAEEARIVRTAALITLLATMPLAAAIFVFSDDLARSLNIPDPLIREGSLALKFAAVIFLFLIQNTVVNTPQLSRLRMDLNSLATAGGRIVGLLAVPAIVYFGYGAEGAVFAILIGAVLAFFGHIAISGRLNTHLFEFSIDRRLIRPMVSFGGVLALSSVAGVLLVHAEKLVLTKQTSVEQLAYYSVAFTLASAAALFGQAMSQSIVPAFAQLLAPEDRSRLVGLFSMVLRISIFGMLPLLVILFVIAKSFFTVWAGPDFGRESTLPFYILLIGLAFNLNAYIPSGFLLASGRSDLFAKLYWIELLPYLLVMFVLAGRFGPVGAAAAWSVRTIVDAIAFFLLSKRIYGVGISPSAFLLPLAAALAIFVPAILVTVIFPDGKEWLHAVVLTVSLTVYAAFLWTSILRSEEKQWISQMIGRA